jgi:hypothetical protein
MTTTTLLILGAPDPEMEAIEALAREAGATVLHAARDGRRVHAGVAYEATDVVGGVEALRAGPPRVVLVECGATPGSALDQVLDTREVIICDHHRPGDPGYGRPPAEFLPASSIGQVVAELARADALPARWYRWPLGSGIPTRPCHIGDPPAIASTPAEVRQRAGQMYPPGPRGCGTPYPWRVEVAAAPQGHRYGCVVDVDAHIVMVAAADHCLAAAYRGECPGIDPDTLMRWRVESRAAFQQRDPGALLSDVAATRKALRAAARIGGAWVGGAWVADMRREPPWPELPEAAAREGAGYVAGPLIGPDGRRKITCSGPPEVVAGFLATWAPSQGLTGLYGDPLRGFAGGYEPTLPDPQRHSGRMPGA